MKNAPIIWALTDDKPGNRTQTIGVVQALSSQYLEKKLMLSRFSALPNRMIGASFRGVSAAQSDALTPPWPDIAIGAGRRLAPVLRAIKRRHPACFATYLMQPQMALSTFDLLAIPAHDNPPSLPNVMATTGAPHALNETVLSTAHEQWAARLQPLATPRIAVLVGGDSGSARYQLEDFHDCGQMASALAETAGGSLMVTTSRRTGRKATDYLRLAVSVDHELYRWSPEAENPYHGFLALADAVVVTGDSMSMCAEACSLGKPVFIFAPRNGTLAPKLSLLHQQLFAAGYARPLTFGETLDWIPPAPLDEAGRIAEQIRQRCVFFSSEHNLNLI